MPHSSRIAPLDSGLRQNDGVQRCFILNRDITLNRTLTGQGLCIVDRLLVISLPACFPATIEKKLNK